MRSRHVAFFLFLALSAHSLGASPSTILPIYSYGVTHDLNKPERPTFKKLKSHFEGSGETNLDNVLSYLKKTYPPLFRSFVLIFKSAGLFHAAVSELWPRVVYHFSGFVASVHGNPAHPASYHSMEVLEYSPEKASFSPYRIRRNRDTGELVFDENPDRCFECHTFESTPILGSYPLWPGHVGQDTDVLSEQETDSLRSLVASLGNDDHKRYKEFFTTMAEVDNGGSNFSLSVHLNYLQFHRIAANLESTSDFFIPYQYAVYGAFLGCGSFEEFFPRDLKKQHEENLSFSLAKLRDDTESVIRAEVNRRVTILETQLGINLKEDYVASATSDLEDLELATRLRFIVNGQEASDEIISFEDWSLSRDCNGYSYNFANGRKGLRDLWARELSSRFAVNVPAEKRTCEDLKGLSLSALESLAPRFKKNQ